METKKPIKNTAAPAASRTTNRPSGLRGTPAPRAVAAHHGGTRQGARPHARPAFAGRQPAPVATVVGKPLAKGPRLRIIPIGGNEEVGRNMSIFEYEDEIIIVDMGLQFPEEDMPGIDYIIPNIGYLKGKEKKIQGVLITHGHYDHIGAIPHLVPALGNPPIYCTPLAANIIRRRQEDFKHIENSNIVLKEIMPVDTLTLGKHFKIEFIHINHNIPQSVAIVITTPAGTVIHTGDWKFDFNPVGEPPADFQKMAEIGKRGVLALMADSTNAVEPGHQLSEREIGETMRQIFQDTKGRLIIGTFASLLSRVQQILNLADEFGRKVAIDGFSMRTNVAILQEMGYLKIKPDTVIDIRDVGRYPANKIIILGTGAQGESNAVLMRIANREHRFVRIEPTDTVIFSSSVIPGNERSVQRLKDTLYREGAKVIHYKMMDVHAGGHAKQEDIKLMLNLLKPRYYLPIEGNHFMLKINGEVAETAGIPKDRIFVSANGQIMEFDTEGNGVMTKEKAPADYVFVDGLGVGDVSHVVLRDRQMMSEDGMLVLVVTVDRKTGALISTPDLISRGFIYLKENMHIIDETMERVKKVLASSAKEPRADSDPSWLKNKLRDDIGQFLFEKTQRRPMILPVVIEV